MNMSADAPAEGLWTAQQVAEYLQINPSAPGRLARSGLLPYIRLGGSRRGPVRFAPADVRDFVERQRQGGGQ